MTPRLTRTHVAALVAVVAALLFAGAATVASAGGDGAGAATAGPVADSAEAGFARDMAVHHQQAVEMSFIVRDRTQDEEVRRLAYDIANTQANQRGMLLGWLDLWGLPKVVSGVEPMAWMASSAPDHSAHSGHGEHGAHGGGDAQASAEGAGGAGGADGADGADGSLMPGMATKAELDQLSKASGRQAEVLYLQLMTDHHKGGVAMAQGCADLCTVRPERNLAQGMVDAQQSELLLMADLLKKRGAAPRG